MGEVELAAAPPPLVTQPEQARLAELTKDALRKRALALPCVGVRREPGLDERPHLAPESVVRRAEQAHAAARTASSCT